MCSDQILEEYFESLSIKIKCSPYIILLKIAIYHDLFNLIDMLLIHHLYPIINSIINSLHLSYFHKNNIFGNGEY